LEKENEEWSKEPDNFGTRWVYDPTHPCDILAGLSVIPSNIKTPVMKELESFIKEDIGTSYACDVMEEQKKCRVSYINGYDFARKPNFGGFSSTFNYVVGDCGISMQYVKSTKQFSDKLREFREKLIEEQKELKKEDYDKINKEIHEYWVDKWYNENAWDFDEKEKKELKNPYLSEE